MTVHTPQAVVRMRGSDEDDPVLASIRRARQRPPLSTEERERLLALDAEAASDPRTWQTTEAFMAKLADHPAAGQDDGDDDE
jgi:hypothetical protein